jgi:predicted nucleic acid-binding protein
MPMERYTHAPLLPRMWELQGNLNAYDAASVALAEALRAPLLTADRRLAKAPGIRASVELVDELTGG